MRVRAKQDRIPWRIPWPRFLGGMARVARKGEESGGIGTDEIETFPPSWLPLANPLMAPARYYYTAPMTRFSLSQPDLFAPAAAPPAVPSRPPLDELAELLAYLRAARHLPWPDAAATMAEERRALGLARLAGPEGDRLAEAILQETERLLAATEQDVA